MAATLLATVRQDLFDTLDAAVSDIASVYRHRQRNYQYPAVIVGWPQTMDVRPSMGDPRDFVIQIDIGVEVVDEDSSDDLLSELLEAAVTALLAGGAQRDVQPVEDFGEVLGNDDRVFMWCRLPVAVYT